MLFSCVIYIRLYALHVCHEISIDFLEDVLHSYICKIWGWSKWSGFIIICSLLQTSTSDLFPYSSFAYIMLEVLYVCIYCSTCMEVVCKAANTSMMNIIILLSLVTSNIWMYI